MFLKTDACQTVEVRMPHLQTPFQMLQQNTVLTFTRREGSGGANVRATKLTADSVNTCGRLSAKEFEIKRWFFKRQK